MDSATAPRLSAPSRHGLAGEASTPFPAGTLLGEYEVLKLLGEGGEGRVYLVLNVVLGRLEALKIPNFKFVENAAGTRRLAAEMRLLSKLDHVNIVKVLGAPWICGQRAMTTEYVDGETLRQMTDIRGVSVEQALAYTSQILSALEYVHGRGFIHRDVSPRNVMVNRSGLVKLLDF